MFDMCACAGVLCYRFLAFRLDRHTYHTSIYFSFKLRVIFLLLGICLEWQKIYKKFKIKYLVEKFSPVLDFTTFERLEPDIVLQSVLFLSVRNCCSDSTQCYWRDHFIEDDFWSLE